MGLKNDGFKNKEARQSVVIDGIAVDVVRKRIKNLHLRISPPYGQVRVTVPLMVRDDAVHSLVMSRLDWIKRHQAKIKDTFKDRLPLAPQEMLSGERYFFRGKAFRLQLVHRPGAGKVVFSDNDILELHVREKSSISQRQKILQQWYREQMTAIVPPLLEKWQPLLKVQVRAWGIKKMKSKWGSCNVTRKQISLNVDLVTKTPECLEYVLVHELVHLLEPSHNKRFKALMDHFLPDWRLHKDVLNKAGVTA